MVPGNTFLGGIWCSVKKPPTAEFLAPILEEIQILATEGEWCTEMIIGYNEPVPELCP